MKLANAAVTLVADGSTVQDFLTYFGRCFIRAASEFGYETIIRVLVQRFINLIFFDPYKRIYFFLYFAPNAIVINVKLFRDYS